MGRPSKYDKSYCAHLIQHMKQGLSYDAFAGVIGVHIDTLYEWEKKHRNFSEAKKLGIAYSLLFWEKLGIAGVAGKVKNFNVGGWIFNMKNRFQWRDKFDVDAQGFEPMTLIMPLKQQALVITDKNNIPKLEPHAEKITSHEEKSS